MASSDQLKPGDNAPDFVLQNATEKKISLSDYRGKWVVLYFYPKDDTESCTREAIEFSAELKAFKSLNAMVIGVSPDSCRRHQNFVKKYSLKVMLLSDPKQESLNRYGVWQKKSMYGKEYMGVVRSTFLIDPDGNIREIWSNLRVPGHVDAVKQTLSDLQKTPAT